MTVAPDLAAPIVAWRAWRVLQHAEGLRLASVVQPTVWEPRRRLECQCLSRRRTWLLGRRRDRHEAPHAPCTCGIYATTRVDLAGRYVPPPAPELEEPATVARVLGRVSLWGRVLACRRGWRAQFAYPARIYVPHDAALGDARAVEELAFALTDYGVPIEIVAHRGERDLLHTLA